MMTAQQKADELIAIFGKELAIKCCDQVLGYMGADRGYAFWSEVKYYIQTQK
jgi:hypothetical protein